ncbi:hypothetical protein HDV02_002697 [Globomyces sp. JEL0801]|nr:hypothetical protein HDV02_002697 [Globomyces sp. JEL0801]
MSPALEPDVNEDKYQNLFSIESKEQLNQRLKLRSANTNPTRPDPSTLSNLDGSIKKNTGFIKKIKAGITAVQANSLKKDLLSLKLEKYLEEVASSIAEGTYKTSADVWTAVEICSMLHYRFENFMDLLKPHLLKSISTLANGINMEGKEKEEQLRIVKERSNIRLFTELYLVGLLDDGAKLKEALIPKMLFELKLQKQEKSNQESFIARGEISEDRQEAYEKRLKLYEKFKINTQSLSTYLFLEMPELPKDEETTRMTIGIVDGRSGKEEKEGNLGAWENEEMKVFYEQILDLANQVPGVLLGKKNDDESKQSEEASVQVEDIIDADVETPVVNETEEVAASELPPAQEDGELKEDLDTDVPEIKGESTQATFTGIVNRMLNALNREAIDSLAVEFAFVNNKGTRKQLIQALLGVSRQRLDLLPYYSRLIATLNPYFPDVGSTVVAELERSFHYHQKKKEQVFIEEKLKNIRFIGELTKFKVTPSHIVFHCLKVLLEDFNFHNVEITCSLLETCGRFLYFNPETNVRTANFLDILLRKKTVLNMDPKYAFMIDNACNPPETSGMVQKHREPIELFLRKLVYKDLSRSTIDVVLKLLRKVDWNDDSIRIILNKLFFKTWKIKFSNLHLMAFLVSELSRYYPDFGIGVVDNTLESIRIGLEHNQFKHNQRRLASMKFLGELYNYRMVDSTTIFETLYLLIRFGHENGIPLPNVYSPLDAPDDFFRLRLACTLLDACGACFRKGSLAKKLDDWLVFMQMYIFTKDPVPIDTEFFVMETIEMLRPKMEFISNYEQAVYMVNSIARSQLQQQYVEPDDDNDNDLNDTMEHENVVEEDGDPDVIEEKDDEEEEEEVDQDAVVHMKEQAAEEEEDELFAREFGRLMQQSIDSRKNERKTVMFDAPVPTRKAIEESQTSPQEGVTFSLLTRKGNKQQVKQMVLPSNSSFAIRTLSKQQAEQEERGRLKELVLNYEERERLQAEQPTVSYNQDGQLTEMTESTPLPVYLETSLLAAKETLESLKHPTELPVLPNDGLNEWSDWFQSSCVKYSIDEKPIFPLAFQYLTCKASQSVFEALIEQEDTFKSTMNDTARQFTTAMKDLHEWYGNISKVSHLNMLNYVNESPEIKQQQVEEVESMFKSWFPQLETLRETQKLEYQAYVLHQYQNLITPLDQVEKSPTSNKMETLNDDIVEGGSDVGEEKIEQSVEATEKPDKKMLNEVLEVNSNDEREETEEMPTEKASSLMQMGFDLSDSNSALEITHDNMVIDPKFYFSKERAVALLLEKPHVVKEHSKSKLMSKKRQPASEKSDLASKRSLSMSKVKHDDVASSLKATSSMFGKFFEKARAAFTVEDDGYEMRFQNEESVVDFANMSESFTVYCGSQQVRTMYNLQLKVSDLSSHLQIQKDRAQFIAMKGSSYQSLYSDSISGMIVPVNINTLFNYGKGSTENWEPPQLPFNRTMQSSKKAKYTPFSNNNSVVQVLLLWCTKLSITGRVTLERITNRIFDIIIGGESAILPYIALSLFLACSRKLLACKSDKDVYNITNNISKHVDLYAVAQTSVDIWEKPLLDKMNHETKRNLGLK